MQNALRIAIEKDFCKHLHSALSVQNPRFQIIKPPFRNFSAYFRRTESHFVEKLFQILIGFWMYYSGHEGVPYSRQSVAAA